MRNLGNMELEWLASHLVHDLSHILCEMKYHNQYYKKEILDNKDFSKVDELVSSMDRYLNRGITTVQRNFPIKSADRNRSHSADVLV